jgi:tetratricopeptide (TPR) repeat protein
MSQQPDEAIQAYRKAIAVRQRMLSESKQFFRLPGLAENHLACAQCFTMKARPAEAANEYQRAGEFLDKAMEKPSSGLLNECNVNNVAWYLATAPDPQFRDPARAVKLAKTSVEIAPNRGDIWNTLGVARYRTGDWQGAIQAHNKSMELRAGGDPVDWYFLAMAEWQLGNKDAARDWYKKAVEWMEKNGAANEELVRFRAEAAEFLGVNEEKESEPSSAPTL